MLRRLAALLFVFALAGQVMASVCVCFESVNAAKHKCCIKTGSQATSVTPKGCCDEENCQISGQSVLGRATGNRLVNFVPTAEPAGEGKLLRPFAIFSVPKDLVPAPFVDQRIKFARPPDLYLRHHSFLI